MRQNPQTNYIMANANPTITEQFRDQTFAMADENYNEPTARSPLQIRIPLTVDAALKTLPNRSAWARQAIIDAARRDGLIPADYGQ
jgi:hypothetical protein